ncbi:MAG: twin-arginine translocase TatA/TatE family subunit [Ktedonobacteraceae bacterium]|nr:twin-arginine translocase TatA/TatE family subunit [Ktedonobacteraceae bacterium]
MPIGFHPFELIILLAIVLLIFGAKRLPEMGASIGKSIKEFQKGMKEINEPDQTDAPATKFETIEREIASKRNAAETKSTIVETPVD